MRCCVYSLASSLVLDNLKQHYQKDYKCQSVEEALCIKIDDDQEVFIMYGAAVFWNMTEQQEKSFIKSLKKHVHEKAINHTTHDGFSFFYGDKNSVEQDVITLVKSEQELNKLAISFGLSQSANLAFFEEKVEETINKYQVIVQQMAQNGVITLTYKEVLKRLGSLFLVRSQINLQSDILDTPDYIWNNPAFEEIYEQTIHNMNLTRRTSVLNKRLDIMQDLFDILNNQIMAIHSTRLEWTIVWLIVIEILVMLILN